VSLGILYLSQQCSSPDIWGIAYKTAYDEDNDSDDDDEDDIDVITGVIKDCLVGYYSVDGRTQT